MVTHLSASTSRPPHCSTRNTAVTALLLLLNTSLLLAQSTISTGNIVGTVTDPSGAFIVAAKITIRNVATGRVVNVTTNSSGTFNAGPLAPGGYRADVFAPGFDGVAVRCAVLLGNTTTINAKMRVGEPKTLVEVDEYAARVNTEQPTVQGVLNERQIENLPVNGRNFQDLAQLEPGVQVQDAGNFGFGFKEGYSSISFDGRFGRTARIEVDGIDISDERFGSATANVPASAIQEFQLSQASMDLSTELTTSGAINVSTRSGTNAVHGEGFEFFRDSRFAAALPRPRGLSEPFQRSQFGGRLGGPIIRQRFFFFIDGERTLQHLLAPVLIAPPFDRYSGNFRAPFRETDLMARADYQLAQSAHVFYRFGYFQNGFTNNGGSGFSIYNGKNITRSHVAGFDFNTGTLSHSFRFGFMKNARNLTDGTRNSSLPFANFPLNIQMGDTGMVTGPTSNAGLIWRQSNHQGKYDGTKTAGSHIFRYGFDLNRIDAAAFVPIGSLAPSLQTLVSPAEQAFAQTGPFPGGISNPLNYPVEFVQVSNGLGYLTRYSGLGLPAGNYFYHRLGLYIGANSSWKRNLTLTYGVRYVRETGRTDSQFAPIPQLNALLPGLGNRVRQPNTNFAPQFGFAWDPSGNGRMVVRGGIGLFYENVLTTIAPQDPSFRDSRGNIFVQLPLACAGTAVPVPITLPSGTLQPTFCSASAGGIQSTAPIPIGLVADQIVGFARQYQANFHFDLNAPNPNYLGTLVSQGQGFQGGVFEPRYVTPRSLVINIGMQREIRNGMILSADFVRNVQTHYFIAVDENHTGDVRYFDRSAALQAISATNSAFNCGSGTGTASIQCAIRAGAQIADYASHGLTSSSDFGSVCSFQSPTGSRYGCAYPGINPGAPPLTFLEPIGRSVYNGLQAKLTQNVDGPVRGIRGLTFQVSYALSRFENSGGATPFAPINSDQDAGIGAIDDARPNRFFGPAVLDRTHQLSFGGYADIRGAFRLSIISHIWSPLSTSLVVPTTELGPGEIFRTDFTGDGTTSDLIPGTHVGNFGRGIDGSNINTVLTKYNSTVAFGLTPAGQILVRSGMFTPSQLGVGDALCYNNPNHLPMNSLCAIAPPVPLAPSGQVGLGWLKALDMRLSWSHRFSKTVLAQPSASFYNLFNFANFDLPGNALNGLLTGTAGQVNGTNRAAHNLNRVGIGTGVYSLGAPRQIEFGLTLLF